MLNSIMNYDRLISKVLFLGYDIAESNKSSLSLEIHFIVSASLFQIHKVKEPTFLKRPDSILGCRGHGIFAGTVWLPPRRKQPQTTCSQTDTVVWRRSFTYKTRLLPAGCSSQFIWRLKSSLRPDTSHSLCQHLCRARSLCFKFGSVLATKEA